MKVGKIFRRIVHIFVAGCNEVFFVTKTFVAVIVRWTGSKVLACFPFHQVVQRKLSGQKGRRKLWESFWNSWLDFVSLNSNFFGKQNMFVAKVTENGAFIWKSDSEKLFSGIWKYETVFLRFVTFELQF